MRIIITEGTWSGYRSGQHRVVHRTVHRNKSPFHDISAIGFTDGTTLDLIHREKKPREKVEIIDGYSKLLWKFKLAGMTGYCCVADLYRDCAATAATNPSGPATNG